MFLLKQRTKPHAGIKKKPTFQAFLPDLHPPKDVQMTNVQKQEYVQPKPKKISRLGGCAGAAARAYRRKPNDSSSGNAM